MPSPILRMRTGAAKKKMRFHIILVQRRKTSRLRVFPQKLMEIRSHTKNLQCNNQRLFKKNLKDGCGAGTAARCRNDFSPIASVY